MFLVIRQNTQYATKTFDVLIELMGIAQTLEEAQNQVLSEVNDYLQDHSEEAELPLDLDVRSIDDFETSADGTSTFDFQDNETVYDIIPVELGFPAKYIQLSGGG